MDIFFAFNKDDIPTFEVSKMNITCKVFLTSLIVFTVLNLFRLYFVECYYDLKEAEEDSYDLNTIFLRPKYSEVFNTWNSCFAENLLGVEDPEKFWQLFEEVSQKCDSWAHVEKLGIVHLKKYERVKSVIFPKVVSDRFFYHERGAACCAMISDFWNPCR
ncbi:hypothetical protein GCK72_001666 [Caenorhabditis remanei]|uniref:Uncharacterized protein n=1 Tax=Caenorhabditis remanei TaxID=31234 RepID=A0A6A5HQ79_CAERE|nr:hypothetical protein GCK72_001666 [Caenorhabditis remanei]KAF1769849.1 hypothetical protein GCK72_001666 [Caenorhabditis remanei]